MKVLRHLPNFLTCCNLACGVLGILVLLQIGLNGWNMGEGILIASALILLAAVFDFLDGFAARMLNATSPIGKDLDSLADMVTFGTLPAILMFVVMSPMIHVGLPQWAPYLVVLIPVMSGLRLAKFNNDPSQSDSFVGLPTPANALFFAALATFLVTSHDAPKDDWQYSLATALTFGYYLPILVVVFALLLVAPVRLVALKFKNFSFSDNKARFILIGLSALLITGGIFVGNVFLSVPVIILLYLVISIINNLFSNEVQSGN